MAELSDPFDRIAYPRLVHREWVLMHQRGVRLDQIARLNHRAPTEVLRFLTGVYGRAPELFHDRPRRELVYDRPRPRPETWPDRDQRFKAALAGLEAFLVLPRTFFDDVDVIHDADGNGSFGRQSDVVVGMLTRRRRRKPGTVGTVTAG